MKAFATAEIVLGVAAVAAVSWGLWKIYEALPDGSAVREAVDKAVDAINPTSGDNLAARGVNAVVRAATGEPETTLGVKIWEWTHPQETALERQILSPTVIRRPAAAPGQGSAVDFGEFNYALPPAEVLEQYSGDTRDASPFWYGAP